MVRGGQVVKAAVEVTYAITSLRPERAGAAALLRLLRGHWGIENGAHHVRDVTFDEDRCQIRTGAAPQAFAACRNLVIALLRRARYDNVAEALRTHAGRPREAVALVASAVST
ncbi:MAG: transposase [Actinomycetota bacterium]|nr:transposase [Actinomycetota bacterium]